MQTQTQFGFAQSNGRKLSADSSVLQVLFLLIPFSDFQVLTANSSFDVKCVAKTISTHN